MTTKTEQRRADLRDRLIASAERTITTEGLHALKARALAQDAGCAVGAIYTVFDDLDQLVLTVNARTFRRLGQFVQDRTAVDGTPQDRLVSMGTAYLHFAAANQPGWRALFDLSMTADSPVPDWYLAELGALFAKIAAPLRDLFPDWSDARIDLMTRALFSSVHGMVLLGLERRISAVPMDHIERMIAVLLRNVTSE
ncbi:DNA-binding transcriptional regulator, AcrR family [Loktanella sp. DSM 29012]|uniref:TetR/AcrR family transcriptional regulator n=1 Tax=Loktanella sp. DSM 29012 TaxID=1881056 RepID=UPI0008CCD707|nr:TetR/AcrR family transcriptional regulator [Loktanella sp. DSM 29012]SEQ00623.1 DNA-binding transcriptional regulator, AcrR family [Loktanella sp. DSM 29012]